MASSSTRLNTAFDDHDFSIIERVDSFLSAGLALKRWWDEAYRLNRFAERFELSRAFNRPDCSFGFFDEVEVNGRPLPVMGNYQEMLYDQPRTPARLSREPGEWMRDQVREFVLRYFMRVSDYRQPEAYVDCDRSAVPPYLERLSWCPVEDPVTQGFGFAQHYYKLRDTGEVGKFPSERRSEIVDLREIGVKYEWIVVKVRIFDFRFTFKPLGPGALDLSIPLTEESYLVLTRDFIANEDTPSSGLLGRYGFGYAFIKDPSQGLIAYGPGQFDAAIELINFDVLTSGETRVSMAFVVNRPRKIANVALDPVGWSFKLADVFSLGLASRLLAPVKNTLETIPAPAAVFDPVFTYVSAANALSGNKAAEVLCISREQLEKDFLVQHFMQHYTTVVGSLLTWRQIPDWLDTAALPSWVIAGRSA